PTAADVAVLRPFLQEQFMAKTPRGTLARVGDAAVQAKTGKTWAEWFAVLDKAKATEWDHATIASYLTEKSGCPEWWGQMVTVGYEQERGLREKHQTPTGYQVSRSKTLPASADTLFAAWNDKKRRAHWMGKDAGFTVRKATAPKSIRI